jgi:endonuclease-3 related protein
MVLSPTNLYTLLSSFYESPNWWPIDQKYHQQYKSDSRFEVIIGAILTQNTTWTNVEKVINNLKEQQMLSLVKIIHTDIESLKNLIKSAGFFNQKAQRLKSISSYIYENYHGDLEKMFTYSLSNLRYELLHLNGIGPETADTILLYAGNKPIFVVDSYTKRLCNRLPISIKNLSYNTIQKFFQHDLMKNFTSKEIVKIYKDLHAFIVQLAKNYCIKNKPRCKQCPIESSCIFNLYKNDSLK